MITIRGKYAEAKIFADEIESTAEEQIRLLCSQQFAEGKKIRIMPDVHAGAGCVIGFTADLGEMVIPNIVGVDIGCGMLTVELGRIDIDFGRLDLVIRRHIPGGRNIRNEAAADFPAIDQMCGGSLMKKDRLVKSIGTLGGGNHFIEINEDEEGTKYLVIHTGSRNLGKQTAEYYQNMAFEALSGRQTLKEEEKKVIDQYRTSGRQKEIQKAVKEIKKAWKNAESPVPRQLCYLTGEQRNEYLKDMELCQQYAVLNRKTIAELILRHAFDLRLEDCSSFETIHNYIDLESNIIRKGAVSARKDQLLLIPLNMRDGSLLCVGKGNEDWNCSAPHGAGRLYSRASARKAFSLEEYRESMKKVYTTSVNPDTLDECPMAYKSLESIEKHIGPTAKILKRLRPLYNYKAAE